MDNVLVDFTSVVSRLDKKTREEYEGNLDNVPGIFGLMEPMPGAIDAYKKLAQKFNTYILSTAPWGNPSAWSDKLVWVKKYLGDVADRRLILTHRKDLNKGDFLIDDRENNGAKKFNGKFIQFGSDQFPDWKSVIDYLLNQNFMKPKECPKCKSSDVKKIIFGLPSDDFAKSDEAKKYGWGGCIVGGDNPAWHCDKCGHEWGKTKDA